ncbi:hypothetical protein [Pseudomonas sp. H3(2019)]|uniref:hypothetical protein n=1 Tax=Pseudomonas sp. H3(2019) TaxID=2598724 RepID=UPI003532273D
MSGDNIFLSADGVVAELGFCEASADQAYLKENMIGQAAQTFVLADATKSGRALQQYWSPLKGPWTLITDSGADESLLAPFRAHKMITLEIANS